MLKGGNLKVVKKKQNPALDASTHKISCNLGGNYTQVSFLSWMKDPEH